MDAKDRCRPVVRKRLLVPLVLEVALLVGSPGCVDETTEPPTDTPIDTPIDMPIDTPPPD